MEIMKNIYQISGGSYANIVNIYVIKGTDSLIMVDTAETASDYQMLEDNLRYWGLDRFPVSCVLLSHKHLNHIGNAWRYRERGARIVAGDKDAEAIEKGITEQICDYDPFPKKEPYVPCKVDLRVRDGDEFEAAGLRFKVYEVPGHTMGSVFYELKMDGRIILFTGDVLNVKKDCSGAYLGWEGGIDFDRGAFFESIKKFSLLDCDVILPGHFQTCMQGGGRILRDAYKVALEEWRQPSVSIE